mmetsp:Transcript_21130/g.55920  ORF Transcript_21130/g.55920 Transcript_21130/m.55920 type:complete len:228 (+) Transcript_21130:386-1069(+)
MRSAKPCAIAVLPTPGSPTKTGLFFERLPRMRIVLSNCCSRPIIGSRVPSRARLVRSSPYFRVSVRTNSLSSTLGPVARAATDCGESPPTAACGRPSCFAIAGPARARTSSGLSQLSRNPRSFVPALCLILITACRRCAVVTVEALSARAYSDAVPMTFLPSAVKGISIDLSPGPRPTICSSAARALSKVMPISSKARAPLSEPSARIPTTSISVPTWTWPSFRASA